MSADFKGYNNSKGISLEACFTPDSQFVMIGKPIITSFLEFVLFLYVLSWIMHSSAGSEDGRVHVWSTESGMKVAVLDGKHPGPINTLQFNPRYMTFASACTNMVSPTITSVLHVKKMLLDTRMNVVLIHIFWFS